MKKIITILMCAITVGFAHAQVTFNNFTAESTSNGLPDNFVNDIAVDAQNNKWFATAAGVARFDENTWTVFNTSNSTGLADNYITCIAVDKDNNIWIGTDGYGVSKFNGSIWTTFTTSDGLANDGVYAIAGDDAGNIWFGTYGSGVTKLNGTSWTTYTYADGLPGNVSINSASINSIFFDEQDNKWFSTDMGIVIYNGTSFTVINQANMDSLPSDYITAIAIDDDNNKWVGTFPYALTKLDNNNNWVANYRLIDGLYIEFVRDVEVNPVDNVVWVGMYADYNQEGGITSINQQTFTSYSVPEGLVDKQIIRMAIDNTGNAWVATGNGVSKVNLYTGITEEIISDLISVFPNPANDFINLKTSNNTIKNVEVFNSLGKIIYSGNYTGRLTIDTRNWDAGMYFVKTEDEVKMILVW